MIYPSMAADLYTLAIYRATASKSATGVTTNSWVTTHSIKRVDVQPASADVRTQFEGQQTNVLFECYLNGIGHNIQQADRVINPNTSPAPTEPNLEIADIQTFPARGGLPAYTTFVLRTVLQT